MTLDSQKMHRTHDGRAAQDHSQCAHVTQATGADQ
jgi:hypothetical protein